MVEAFLLEESRFDQSIECKTKTPDHLNMVIGGLLLLAG